MKKYFSVLVLLLLVTITHSDIAFADINEKAVLENFSAEINSPDNQINKNASYFDLELKPGEKQTISIDIKNKTDENLKINASFNKAWTNKAGVVSYAEKNKPKISKKQKNNIEELVRIEDSVIDLKPQESRSFKMDIKMPNEKLEGVLAGGIYLTADKPYNEKGNIKNYFSREIALVLRNDKGVNYLDGKIELDSVSVGSEDFKNAFFLNFKNPNASFLKGFELSGNILDSKNETYLSFSKDNMSLAPNSEFSFPVLLNGKKFESGNYKAIGQVRSEEKIWTFEKEFLVKSEDVKKYNKKDVSIEPNDNRLLIAILGIGVVLFIFLLIIIIIMLNKKKKNSRKKKVSRKRRR